MKNIYLGILAMLTSFSLVAQAPQTSICMVTVDSASTHNIVIWERADQVSVNGIDSMMIYRLDLSGTYNLIGTVDYADLSEFEDHAVDPNVQSYSYKIAGYDNSGLLGSMSSEAETIHFSAMGDDISGTMELNWSAYVGGTVNTYSCIHQTTNVGDTSMFNTTNNSLFFWTMLSPVPGVNYEMFTTANGIGGCTSTKANHNTSRSNKNSGGVMLPTAIEENNIVNLKISPNPADYELNVEFSSVSMSKSKVVIYNLLGEVVLTVPEAIYYGRQKINLDVSNLNAGLYLVTLQNGIYTKTLRFSKK